LRVVGGSHRGRTLRAVPGAKTRPTADRVRQSLFDTLGQRMDGLAVLDLYAGTGALAIEALSRGAASAVLVENDARACAVIFGNLSDLGLQARVLRGELPGALDQLRGEKFDLVFSDPPYSLHAAQATLDAVGGLLAPGARVVIEMDRREPAPSGLPLADERKYGDTIVRIFENPAPA
jgi:16S rRNA (guanine966-N2)-methyltransferase